MNKTEALSLMDAGECEKAAEIFRKLTETEPVDAELQYYCASCLDACGVEREAAGYYEQAISLGLTGKNLEYAYVQLGSTYRTLGEYEKAREVLEKGRAIFPDNRAVQVFYAMTLYNMKEHHEAMKLLLNCLTEKTSDKDVLLYKKSLQFYAGRLDETWDE
ncbi:hypothetical protein CR205_03355 [Alteribacter lacisalsi]|uniref:Tetratrico peptide repeat group 5 domain-containing protein n=1 Tax=Alteribacter lacisalsi TaxID=2045244 RepID=A0A2W0HJG7_9BACI|nr:tetratricopeptide repeat protein [Alteribacter lacisalsi]PYZ97645.1 hypothetical protein CR205_03355 [Alteribacter lacisalsi]